MDGALQPVISFRFHSDLPRLIQMKRTLNRIAKAASIAVAFLALTGCLLFLEFFFGIAPLHNSSRQADLSLPELSGDYPVGRHFVDWVDLARSDPFHPSSKRELVVSIWYPASRSATNQTGTYLPGKRGLLTARFRSLMIRIRTQNLWSALLRNPLPADLFTGIRTRAIDSAEISAEKQDFPVLIFSPGYGAAPDEYSALLEDIASHGYVIFAIYPTGFEPVTVFEDGRTIYASVLSTSLYNLEKAYSIWVQDIVFVLNEISLQNSDPKSPWLGRLDLTKIGAFGHSFGGAAAAGACQFDSRIRAGLNLDGAPQGARSTWNIDQPFMLVQSDGRPTKNSTWNDFYKGLTVGYRVVIKGSTHHAFTDETILPLPDNQRRKRLVGGVPGDRMVRLTSTLVAAFFDVHMQNKPATLLQDISSQFAEITIETSGLNHNAIID